jgi:hypothetical protein
MCGTFLLIPKTVAGDYRHNKVFKKWFDTYNTDDIDELLYNNRNLQYLYNGKVGEMPGGDIIRSRFSNNIKF